MILSTNRRHLRLACAVTGLLLAAAHWAAAQSTNGFPKSGPALQIHGFSDTTGGLTLSTNILYRLPAAKNTGFDLKDAPAATSLVVPPGWAQQVATGIDHDDTTEHGAYVNWMEAH